MVVAVDLQADVEVLHQDVEVQEAVDVPVPLLHAARDVLHQAAAAAEALLPPAHHAVDLQLCLARK